MAEMMMKNQSSLLICLIEILIFWIFISLRPISAIADEDGRWTLMTAQGNYSWWLLSNFGFANGQPQIRVCWMPRGESWGDPVTGKSYKGMLCFRKNIYSQPFVGSQIQRWAMGNDHEIWLDDGNGYVIKCTVNEYSPWFVGCVYSNNVTNIDTERKKISQ